MKENLMNNNQANLNKLEQVRLLGMASAFRLTMETGIKHQFTPDELLNRLVDSEWDDRRKRKLGRLLKAANFRLQAGLEQIISALSATLIKTCY
jgi:hypothetical protein